MAAEAGREGAGSAALEIDLVHVTGSPSGVSALDQWAFSSITASAGAWAFYDRRRAAGDSHHKALRALANRWVGILHGCLDLQTRFDENTAWGHRIDTDLKEVARAA